MAVCLAIFDNDHNLMLNRRAKEMTFFSKAWVMPGGHLELGETLEAGVCREAHEETGLEIKYSSPTGKKEDARYYYNG